MFFISHRSTDKQFALDLIRRAQERGYSSQQMFLDSDRDAGIAAGADWEQEIYNRLKDCRALIVVCSPRLAESKWCFAELVVAKTLGKLVFPVVVEDCPLDAFVGERQAVFAFKEGDAAYDRLWKALEQHGLGPNDIQPWPPLDEHGKPTDACPYPGLMAFSERFAPVFFGRDPEIAAVLDKLNGMRHRGEPRMLLIHGGSGSGKSSLLKAGVLPRLARNRDWLVLPTLRYGETPNDDETLFAKLAKELTVRFPPDSSTRLDWKDLRAKFKSDDVESAAQCFIDVTQDLTMALGCHDVTTLLPLDQFEELLTSSVRPSADKFLKFLRVLLSRNNGKLLTIATLRSDYLDAYERNPHSLQPPYLLTDRLPPFPWERVTDVIVQPAARVSVTFTNELLERLKLDAPTSDALPLLAFTLEKLFRECAADKQIELDEYKSLGGMTGAIEQAVNKIVPSKLPPETEQALRLSFVRHLVQVNEKDEFVRRPARWSDLPVAARPILERFVNERLLHTSGDGSATTVEVSHEALFRCWPQLVDWLKVSARVLRWRRDVERDRCNAFDAIRNELTSYWHHVRDYLSRFFTGRDKENWSGLTRVQLSVSHRWPTEIPEELSAEEIEWIRGGVRRDRIFYSTIATVTLLFATLGCVALYLRSVAVEQTGFAVEQTGIAQKEAATSRRKARIAEANRLLVHFASASSIKLRSDVDPTGLPQDPTVFELPNYRTLERRVLLAIKAGQSTDHEDEGLLPRCHQALLDSLGEWPARPTSENPNMKATANHPLIAFELPGTCSDITADGRWAVTGNDDGTVNLWNLQLPDPTTKPQVLEDPEARKKELLYLRISTNGEWVVTKGYDKTRIWDLREPGKAICRQVLDDLSPQEISDDGRWLLGDFLDVQQRSKRALWDLNAEDPASTRREVVGADFGFSASFSSNSHYLVTSSGQDLTRIMALPPGQSDKQEELKGHGATTAGVRISPESNWIATAAEDDMIRLTHWKSKKLRSLQGFDRDSYRDIFSLSFSQDSRWLIASANANIYVWDLTKIDEQSPTPLPFPINNNELNSSRYSITMSSDSSTIIGLSQNRVFIWNWRSPGLINQPLMLKIGENRSGEGRPRNVAFNSDNRWIVEHADGTPVRLYRWKWNDDLIAAAHKAIGRDSFTKEELAEFFPEEER